MGLVVLGQELKMGKNSIILKHIGKLFRQRRRFLGITQKQLGENIGKKHQSIYQHEYGRCNLTVETFMQICDELNMNYGEVLDASKKDKN